MVRDVTDDKIDYTLVLDGPMFVRWAEHLTKGAKKYEKRNWMKAATEEEEDRFRESALRHFLQWYWRWEDEDHAAATFFNINGAEYTKAARAAAEEASWFTSAWAAVELDRPGDSQISWPREDSAAPTPSEDSSRSGPSVYVDHWFDMDDPRWTRADYNWDHIRECPYCPPVSSVRLSIAETSQSDDSREVGEGCRCRQEQER
jgi:hypothetical protein